MLKKIKKKILIAGLAMSAATIPIVAPIAQPATTIAADNFTGVKNGKYYRNGTLFGEVLNVSNGWYEIHSAVPGKTDYVLDVTGAAFANGPSGGSGVGNIQMYKDNNTIAQRFYFKSLGNGLYNIICGTGDHAKNIDVVNGKKGANIRQWSKNTASAQKFRVIKNKTGKISFINESTGQAIDIAGDDNFANGRNVWDYPYKFGNDKGQSFSLVKVNGEVPSNPSNIQNGWYKIHASRNTDYTLDIANASGKNGANIQLYRNNNTKAKYFYIKNLGNGEYQIYTRAGNNTVLDVDTKTGTNLLQWEKHNGANQKWKIYKFRNGVYSFISLYNSKTIDIAGNKNYYNKQNVQVYKSIYASNGLDPGEGQGWKLVKKDTGTITFHKNTDSTTCKTSYIIEQNDQKFHGSFNSWKRPGYTLAGWSLNKKATKADYPVNAVIHPGWFNKNKDKNNNVNVYAVWQKKDTVTPEEFGAKGDGKTNDTNAIQKTVDFGAQNIKFTKTYYVASPVHFSRNNINSYGGGTFKFPNTDANMFQIHGKNTNFTNLKFTGNNGGFGACLWFFTHNDDINGAYKFNSTIKNCSFTNTGKRGVDIVSAKHNVNGWANTGSVPRAGFITVTGCRFDNIKNIALCTAGATNLTISNNTFNNSELEHITLDWSTRNSTVTGNRFYGYTGGCGVIGVDTAWDCVIKNNTFSTTKRYADNKHHVRTNDETGKSKNIQVQKNAEVSAKYTGTWKAV